MFVTFFITILRLLLLSKNHESKIKKKPLVRFELATHIKGVYDNTSLVYQKQLDKYTTYLCSLFL